MSKLEVVYYRFFQFWLIFLNQNYQSRSKEYNFNWCWHRTLPLKKKRFPVFENLFKTSGITTKVLQHAWWSLCKLWECRPQVPNLVNSTLPSPPPGPVSQFPWKNFPTLSAEEFYYSFYYNEGLENKLTRAPLLGLAKSIYYDSQISVPAAFPSSTIVQFVYPWPVIDTLRLTNISQFFSTPTID